MVIEKFHWLHTKHRQCFCSDVCRTFNLCTTEYVLTVCMVRQCSTTEDIAKCLQSHPGCTDAGVLSMYAEQACNLAQCSLTCINEGEQMWRWLMQTQRVDCSTHASVFLHPKRNS